MEERWYIVQMIISSDPYAMIAALIFPSSLIQFRNILFRKELHLSSVVVKFIL